MWRDTARKGEESSPLGFLAGHAASPGSGQPGKSHIVYAATAGCWAPSHVLGDPARKDIP